MTFTANSIASLVKGIVEGNGDVQVDSFSKIEEGRPGSISFLANPKYTQYLYTTQASVVLVAKSLVLDKPVAATLIRVDDPYETIAELMQLVAKATAELPVGIEEPSFVAKDAELQADVYVGAFAYVGAGAKLMAGCKVYPQAYVGSNCIIGEGTILHPGVKVYEGCKIGKNCIIHSGAVIGADGFGFAPTPDGNFVKIPQMGIVEIADNVEIGANTTIDRAMMGATKIHQGVKLDNLIQIAHNVEIGENTVMAAQAGIAGSAKIGKNCMFGGQVGIAGHISIGDRVQLGAQTGCPKSIPSDKRMMGYPAIPGIEFAKQFALLKRLPALYDRVEQLEKNEKGKE